MPLWESGGDGTPAGGRSPERFTVNTRAGPEGGAYPRTAAMAAGIRGGTRLVGGRESGAARRTPAAEKPGRRGGPPAAEKLDVDKEGARLVGRQRRHREGDRVDKEEGGSGRFLMESLPYREHGFQFQ